MSKWVCRVLGVVFVVAGLATFGFGDAADFTHNVLHLVTGLVALGCGFATRQAGLFCLTFGPAYLAFGVLGLLSGWHAGPLHLTTGDHVFHVVLGAVVLIGSGRFADRLAEDAQAQ